MKDFVQILKDDLEKGYSKSDLERLIGLPQNCLSGIIKGDKKLSRKSQIKIEQWEVSEKPNPLQVYFVKKKVVENNLQENKERILAERNELPKEKSKQTYPLKTSEAIPPIPIREEGEEPLDFAARKNEWKRLYQK